MEISGKPELDVIDNKRSGNFTSEADQGERGNKRSLPCSHPALYTHHPSHCVVHSSDMCRKKNKESWGQKEVAEYLPYLRKAIKSTIYSFYKYLWSAYCMPGTILVTVDIGVNKTVKNHCLIEAYHLTGERDIKLTD